MTFGSWAWKVTFLGTCSGGGPTISRACTSTAMSFIPPRSHEGRQRVWPHTWLVDCAEGTQLQLQKTWHPRIPLNSIKKVFVTHMHVDHVMGIIPMVNNAMRGNRASEAHLHDTVRIELYGPAGLRRLLRTNMTVTRMVLMGKYAAHELLTKEDQNTPCTPSEMHPNESPGRDIYCDTEGFWRDFVPSPDISVDAGPIVHRAPCLGYSFTERQPQTIRLRDAPPVKARRKVVILGDTSDPSGVIPIAMRPSLLVHEATHAWMPPDIFRSSVHAHKVESAEMAAQETVTVPAQVAVLERLRRGMGREARAGTSGSEAQADGGGASAAKEASANLSLTHESSTHAPTDEAQRVPKPPDLSSISREPVPEESAVYEKAILHGHSTPDMAGAFAKRVQAQSLYLNHFSVKYPDPGHEPHNKSHHRYEWHQSQYQLRKRVMAEIERQATLAWLGERERPVAVAARDHMVVDVPFRDESSG